MDQDERGRAPEEGMAEGASGGAADDGRKPLLALEDAPKKTRFTPKAKKELREWGVSLAVALIAVALIRLFLFTVINVEGPSMEDTLQNGDRLIVTIIDAKLAGYDRFDVVVCHYPVLRDAGRPDYNPSGQGNFPDNPSFPLPDYVGTRYVKRIIGLPGDTIDYRDGVTYINGEPIEEPFLYPEKSRAYRAGRGEARCFPVEIPEGYYFVMGDHRDNSNDSRKMGLIRGDQLIGRARLIFWPPSHWAVVGSGAADP